VTPLLLAVPFLFISGVSFGYFVVLPAAVRFFVNFNASEFNILVQASQFYGFAATLLLAMGLIFQVPVVILGATKLGLITPRQLRKARRYAIVACAAVAAFLPGDAITLILETLPLYVLYEASILVAALVWRAESRSRERTGGQGPPQDPPPPPDLPSDPTVQDMIDHVDPRLQG
jgi:sec-independent protein translocase protein TatC